MHIPGLTSSTSTNQRLRISIPGHCTSSSQRPPHRYDYCVCIQRIQCPSPTYNICGAHSLNALGLPLTAGLACSRAWRQREAQSDATTERGNSSLGRRLYGLVPPWDLIYFVVLFLLAPCGYLSCVASQIDCAHKLRCGRGRPSYQPTGQIPSRGQTPVGSSVRTGWGLEMHLLGGSHGRRASWAGQGPDIPRGPYQGRAFHIKSPHAGSRRPQHRVEGLSSTRGDLVEEDLASDSCIHRHHGDLQSSFPVGPGRSAM